MLWDEKLLEQEKRSLEGLSGARMLSYTEALHEALSYKMETDPSVFLLGQGVDDPGAMFGVTKGFKETYGDLRVFDTPVSEEGITGICNGAAMGGMRPVYFHNRPDFLLLAFNQIVNHGSKIHWMDNGKNRVPLVIWSAIGRGWGSGPQHSQAIHSLFLGVPGLKIVLPSTPYDAKGLLISAIEDDNPVLIFEHRWLMKQRGAVPKEPYKIPFGKGVIRQEGTACTVVGTSHALDLAWKAAQELKKEKGVDAEVIDLRTIQPLDEEIILTSVRKTGKLLIVDTGWKTGGILGEIGSLIAEKGLSSLKKPIKRVGLPHTPSPAGQTLENFYYPNVETMKHLIKELCL
jgi:pyruvate/2-oxoglutarate/acetoin dehydrogenase E1 component